ncbi:MAG: hypothetical protein ACJ76J_07120 [Thermoanaerobaculia bacterium]
MIDLVEETSARERVESLMKELQVADGKRASLGLFTPAPEPGLEAAAVAGEPADGGLRLTGRVRVSDPDAEASIVLVKAGGEHRLAWLEHGTQGVERRGDWLAIEGAVADRVSRPVEISDLRRWLESYAGAWALAAAMAAREGVRALRRAARVTGFNASQWVALGITEVEIEADLTLAAAKRNPGLAVAAAAARTLSLVAAKAEELRELGVETEELPSSMYLGGALFLENELARALRIGEARE